jgi:hypothetical protein
LSSDSIAFERRFETVKLFLDCVKRIVTNLVSSAHFQDSVTGGIDDASMQVGRLQRNARGARIRIRREDGFELMPHRIRGRRLITAHPRQPGGQGTFPR